MQKRERAWIICLAALYFCVGIILTVLMNTTPDRQSAEENKVFFTASHAVVAVMIGYGLALLSSYMATHYRSFRSVGLMLGAITLLPALVVLFDGVGTTFYGGVGAMTYQKTLFLFLSMVAAFVLAALAAHWFMKTKKTAPRRMTIFWSGCSAARRCFFWQLRRIWLFPVTTGWGSIRFMRRCRASLRRTNTVFRSGGRCWLRAWSSLSWAAWRFIATAPRC